MGSTPPQKALFVGSEEELTQLENSFKKEHRTGLVVENLDNVCSSPSILLWKTNAEGFLANVNTYEELNDMSITFLALSKAEFHKLSSEWQGELLASSTFIYND